MDIMTALDAVPGIGPALPYIAVAIAVCSALASFLPAPKTAGGWYGALFGAVHFVALNMGKARAAIRTPVPANTNLKPPAGTVAVLALAVAGALMLSACTADSTAANVAALESALTAAERGALAYTSLPRCPQPTPVCSDPAKVAAIKAADMTAYNAVSAAEASVRAGNTPDVTAAEAAVAALTALMPPTPATNKGV